MLNQYVSLTSATYLALLKDVQNGMMIGVENKNLCISLTMGQKTKLGFNFCP
jgi:hypothetical protein